MAVSFKQHELLRSCITDDFTAREYSIHKPLHITGQNAHIYLQIVTDGKWIRHVLLAKQSQWH